MPSWKKLMLLIVGVMGCASVPTVMGTPRQTLIVSDYDSDKSTSILKTEKTAEKYCRKIGRGVPVLVHQDTIYQGQYQESVNEAAKTAGEAAAVYGSVEGYTMGHLLSSPTDYRTTIEFTCQ